MQYVLAGFLLLVSNLQCSTIEFQVFSPPLYKLVIIPQIEAIAERDKISIEEAKVNWSFLENL